MKATITVTHGEVVCTPVPYHSFRVGPFSLTVEVDKDRGIDAKDIEQLVERTRTVLREQARKEYAEAKAFWLREWASVSGR